MAMSLDSHVVNRSSSPGPGGLKLMPGMCPCVPKIPRGEWRRRDCGVAIPPGGDFSLSLCLYVSLCLSGERTRPTVKISPKKKYIYMCVMCIFFFFFEFFAIGHVCSPDRQRETERQKARNHPLGGWPRHNPFSSILLWGSWACTHTRPA